MTTVQIMRNQHGDDEAHAGGCGHIARLRRYQQPGAPGWGGATFSGPTLREAIREADTDMADAFGQTVYQPDASDRPWTVAVMAAPCLRCALTAEGLRFDDETGEAVPVNPAPEAPEAWRPTPDYVAGVQAAYDLLADRADRAWATLQAAIDATGPDPDAGYAQRVNLRGRAEACRDARDGMAVTLRSLQAAAR